MADAPAAEPSGEPAAPPPSERVFLVVVDESEEMKNALRYACRRAVGTNGRVALLHVIEPESFQHWLGVGRVLEEETRREAEQRLQTLAAKVFQQTGKMPALHLREGKRAEELVKLVREDPSLSLLVLATSSEGSNPGPIISYLVSNLGKHVRIPVTLVPGQLSEEEIDAVS